MFFSCPVVYGEVVVIPDISGKYSARILMDHCDKYACRGRARISLFRADTHEKISEIESDDFDIAINTGPSSNQNFLSTEEDGNIVIGDFDFDGHDDFAVQDGYKGSYGYASYDVYTYDKKRKIYSRNSALTRLAGGEYLGMFQIDKKRKRLLAYNKAADGVLYSFEFTSNGRGLKKVCEKTEIWNQSNGIVEVTVKRFAKNMWVTRKRSFSAELYDLNKMAEPGRCSFLNQ